MPRTLLIFLTVLLLSVVSSARSEDLNSVQKQIDNLQKQHKELNGKYYAIRDRYNNKKEVAKLRSASANAYKKIQEMGRTDKGIKAARTALQNATVQRDKRVEEQLSQHREGSRVLAQIEQIRDRRADSEFGKALAEFHITHRSSRIARTLAKDKNLATLREQAYKAQGKQRGETQRKYQQAREARIKAMPDAKYHWEAIQNADKAIKESYAAESKANTRLGELRSVLRDNTDIQAIDDRNKQLSAATNSESLTKARKVASTASYAYAAKLNELLANDENAQQIQGRLRKLGGELQRLSLKRRGLDDR